MALEYRLKIETKIPLLNYLENYLDKNSISVSKEKIQEVTNIYLYERFGFMISTMNSEKVFFDYLINEKQVIEEYWDYSNDMNFRLDKFYNNLLARLHMIDICVYILYNTKENARLLFNGDILVLERTNGIISINQSFGFWNSVDLLDKIKSIM